MFTIYGRISESVQLLDVYDSEWAQRINLDKLDLLNNYRCILGQLFGHYERGRYELRLDSHPAASDGFDILNRDPSEIVELEGEWRAIVTIRRR